MPLWISSMCRWAGLAALIGLWVGLAFFAFLWWRAPVVWALMMFGPFLAAAAALWVRRARQRRRSRSGFCPNCAYDRAGLEAHRVCPECGIAPIQPVPPNKEAPVPLRFSSPP